MKVQNQLEVAINAANVGKAFIQVDVKLQEEHLPVWLQESLKSARLRRKIRANASTNQRLTNIVNHMFMSDAQGNQMKSEEKNTASNIIDIGGPNKQSSMIEDVVDDEDQIDPMDD